MGKRKNFYAVAKGKKIGIYKTWFECQEQISGYSGAVHKGFETYDEAEFYLEQNKNHGNLNYKNLKNNFNFEFEDSKQENFSEKNSFQMIQRNPFQFNQFKCKKCTSFETESFDCSICKYSCCIQCLTQYQQYYGQKICPSCHVEQPIEFYEVKPKINDRKSIYFGKENSYKNLKDSQNEELDIILRSKTENILSPQQQYIFSQNPCLNSFTIYEQSRNKIDHSQFKIQKEINSEREFYYQGLISRNCAKISGIVRVYTEINVRRDYDFYEGEFSEGQMHGFGRLIAWDGTFYQGQFKNGKYEGKGILQYPNGDIYEGYFHGNTFEGQGQLQSAQKNQY